MQQLGTNNACQVALVGELAEHGSRGASHGILEIDRISQIDGQGDAVHQQEESLAKTMIGRPLLPMQREEHQHDIQHIGIENG